MVRYAIDAAHSYIGFSVRHMMVTSQRGQFHDVSGTLELDETDVTRSSVEAIIEVASIDTHEAQRDAHLKGPDFFDAAAHPHLTFRSRRVEERGDRLAITGDLTLRGVTREVVLDAEAIAPESKDPFGNTKIGTSATTVIRRKDFGLVWNAVLETGGVAVGDEVKITLDLEFTRLAAQGAAA